VNPTQLRELLAAHDLRPSKALGQHFLADANTADRIVRLAGVEPGMRVVEVGPGVGSLTVPLLDAGAHVRAIEFDRHVLPVLQSRTEGRDIEIVNADAMTVDWSAELAGADEWAMVANLPYNVATPMLMRALAEAPMITRYLVMVQREVGERIAASVGDDAFGAVSVKVAWWAAARVVGRVPPTVFLPPPNVDSALVELIRHPSPPVAVHDPARMFTLINAGFATRRKMLRRTLAGMVTPEAFGAAGIDPTARAETLTLAEWARLSDAG
jgi:16S rRNA (adenine1518-N6/adenine1519-N6)-dimethyltransferase